MAASAAVSVVASAVSLSVAAVIALGLSNTPARAADAAPAGCPPQAGAPTPAQLAAAQSGARDRGFLWRLERDGQRSWLYGTLHVARQEWLFPGPQVLAALQGSSVVALELDLADPALHGPARAPLSAKAADGVAGEPALPGALQRRLAARLAAECLPAGNVAALPPMLQAATLSALAGRRDGFDPAYAIDAMLAGFGHTAGKRVVELETLEQQLAVLRGDGVADTLHFVTQTLDELERGRARQQIRRIAQVWADGDLDALARYPQWCECLDTPADRALMRRLLDDRNAAMAARIDALHRAAGAGGSGSAAAGGGGGIFAAVGSLHMIGAQGLPALLAARGYRVQRIAFTR